MANFKILNITGTLAKRHPHYNTPLSIDYVTGYEKKSFSLKPNEEFFLTTPTLPTSVHILRMKNFVTVLEIGDKELSNQKSAKQKLIAPVKQVSDTASNTENDAANDAETKNKNEKHRSKRQQNQSEEN